MFWKNESTMGVLQVSNVDLYSALRLHL